MVPDVSGDRGTSIFSVSCSRRITANIRNAKTDSTKFTALHFRRSESTATHVVYAIGRKTLNCVLDCFPPQWIQQTLRCLLSCHVSDILIYELQIVNSQVFWPICFHQSWQAVNKNHSLNTLFPKICPLCDFTQWRMEVTDISVKPIGPNINCQAVQEFFVSWKWDQEVVPEHRSQSTILCCVKSQKIADLTDRAAEVWIHAPVFLSANCNTSNLTHNIHDKNFEEIFTIRFFGSYRRNSWQHPLESELNVPKPVKPLPLDKINENWNFPIPSHLS